MDWMEFVSSLAGSLAWPIVLLVVFCILKKDISKALQQIKKVSHGDTQIDFSREMDRAKQDAQELLPETVVDKDKLSKSEAFASLSPRGAIIESWLSVENSLRAYAKRNNIMIDEKRPFSTGSILMHNYYENQGIGKGLLGMIGNLMKIRNEAVHLQDANITPESALEYVNLANRVINRIDEA